MWNTEIELFVCFPLSSYDLKFLQLNNVSVLPSHKSHSHTITKNIKRDFNHKNIGWNLLIPREFNNDVLAAITSKAEFNPQDFV